MIGFILIGAPCCGKSTIGKEVSKITNIEYISSGNIARDMAKTDKQISNDLINGKLAPEEFMRKAVLKTVKQYDYFILDGFPRFTDQFDWICSNLSAYKLVFITVDADYNTIVKRFKDRGRDDDNMNAFHNRMEFHITKTMPMIQCIRDSSYKCYCILNNDGEMRHAVSRLNNIITDMMGSETGEKDIKEKREKDE